MNISGKLEAFRARVESDTRARYAADWERDKDRGMDYPLSIHEPQMCVKVKIGRKYANVDVGSSGKYMVTLDTGEIYGIKAYGVIHRGHHYGTLDTTGEWDWGGFTARKLQKVAA